MASRRHARYPRRAMARDCHHSWACQEDDLSDTSTMSSTDAIKSHSEPATDDEDDHPPETLQIGEESPKLEPPTEADMEEMKIIASSSTTDEILTKMLGRHDVGERRSAIIATMQTVRANVQQQFNGAINAVIQAYVQDFFKPAVGNLKCNFGEISPTIDKDILDKISCDLLDNSKLQYNAVSVRPRTPIPLPLLTDPDAMPLYESADSDDFNELSSWLPSETPTVRLAASPPLDRTMIGMGRSNVVTPVELTQRLAELQNGEHLLGDGSMMERPPTPKPITFGDDSERPGLVMEHSGWLGNGRLVKRCPQKRAYCFGGGENGDEGDAAEPKGPKKFRSKYGNLSNGLLRSLMSLLYKHKMFWNASVITTTTKFLTDIQANRAFGYAMDGEQHFPTYHPDVVRYMPDLEDRDWLLQQKLIEQPHARVLLLVYDEVGYIRATDCRYRLKSTIDLSAIRTFTLPEFIIEKMKKFFSHLNLASRGLITYQKPVGRELNIALRRCLPLVPAHYSAFANWAIAAAATERNRSPSKELLNIFKASFEAVAAMVKKRRRLEQLAERRALEEALSADDAETYSRNETDELDQQQKVEATPIEVDGMEGDEDGTDDDQQEELDLAEAAVEAPEAITPITNSPTAEHCHEDNEVDSDIAGGQPLRLTTFEILSKIPATITVTPRNSKPSIQLKTASTAATIPEWTIIRRNSQLKIGNDCQPDVTIRRQSRLLRPPTSSGMRTANETVVAFTIPPELIIFRRCPTTSGCGGNSVVSTEDAD